MQKHHQVVCCGTFCKAVILHTCRHGNQPLLSATLPGVGCCFSQMQILSQKKNKKHHHREEEAVTPTGLEAVSRGLATSWPEGAKALCGLGSWDDMASKSSRIKHDNDTKYRITIV